MFLGFWKDLKRPIVGLSPMDGVTDAAMRWVTKKYGEVDVVFTEFVSAEGIERGVLRLMDDFLYEESERPIVAQIFGKESEVFYVATLVVCALGFDGVDINMGCPAKNVASRGAGAGLILTPDLAKEIVREAKKAIDDWSDGLKIEKVIDKKIFNYIKSRKGYKRINSERKKIPISIKTRIGFDKPETVKWMKELLSMEPAVISMHGRTLRQGYGGKADWGELGKAAKLAKKSQTLFLGNGDIKSLREGKEKAKQYDLDGFLIGRAALGNPWVFKDKEVGYKERLEMALIHAKKFEELFPKGNFLRMRKHLGWYAKGFEQASKVREKFVRSNDFEEVEKIIRGL